MDIRKNSERNGILLAASIILRGFALSTTELQTTEERGPDSFTIKLCKRPLSDVTHSFSSNDLDEGDVSPGNVIFTYQDWNQSHGVLVRGVDDDLDDGSQEYSLHFDPVVSDDISYNGQSPDDSLVTNVDDETANFIVGSISDDSSEDGTTATFTVWLSSEPTADVSIDVSSGDEVIWRSFLLILGLFEDPFFCIK